MFVKDSAENFYIPNRNHGFVKHIFWKLYKRYVFYNHRDEYIYFWLVTENPDKEFYRITDRFFIEIKR